MNRSTVIGANIDPSQFAAQFRQVVGTGRTISTAANNALSWVTPFSNCDRRRGNGMALWTGRGALACVLVALGIWTQAAAGGFVLFHKTFGDWVVLCWREMAGQEKNCTLSAPQPSLAYKTPPNVVQVHEYRPDAFQIVISIRDRADPELPASLRVDRFEFRTARVERGLARWFGEEAVELLVQMRAGKRLAYRVQTAPDGLPRDMNVSLAGFTQALATYREVIRSHGLLGPKG